MKHAIRLRTSLTLSFATLTAVAMIALTLSLVGVLYIAHGQNNLVKDYYKLINISYHFTELLHSYQQSPPQSEAQLNAAQGIQLLLAHTEAELSKSELRQSIDQVRADLDKYFIASQQPNPSPTHLELVKSLLQHLRESLVMLQQQTLLSLDNHANMTQRQSFVFALMLCTAGLALLIVGYIAVRNMTDRISRPIEALALCADQIGNGDFNIKLPQSRISEFVALSRRVAAMTGALRQLKASDMRALTLGKDRLQAVLDSIDDGLLILDLQGRLQHLNPVALSQLNCGREAIGQTLGSLTDHAEIDQQVRQVLTGQEQDQLTPDLVINAQQTQRLLAYRITPITQHKGAINGVVIVLNDVTQERAFERLRQDFVLRASHELRTPVTGMQMAFGLLCERLQFPPDSREADLINTVQHEMTRLLELISNLLNFSRYQSGVQRLERSFCNIADIIQSTAQCIQEKLQKQQLSLALDIPKALPDLYLDQQRIALVLEHLFANAIRHSPKHSTIRVQVRQHGQRIVVGVEDQGLGIALDQQLRIFEPFVQVGINKGGVGLGLALCKEIIQLHGGRIGVYSRPHAGTQFYFSLPLTTSLSQSPQ